MWFALQFVLFCGIVASPFFGTFDGPLWLRAAGLLILALGVVVAVLGYRTLGRSHSAWTNPVVGGHLVTTGIYGYFRHPIYAGWILGVLGWALLWSSLFGLGVAAALFVFYDLKSREEERWLLQKYPRYAAYKSTVRRFIPGVY